MKPLNLLPKLLRSSRIRFIVLVATLLSLLTVMSTGFAVDITGISAQWRTPPSGSSGDPTCYTIDNTAPLVELRYGDNDAVTTDCPSSSAAQSGFGFTNGNTGTYTNGTPFILGELTHYNNQVFASSLLTSAYLDFTFTSTAPALPAFETLISLDETANNLQTCPYGDSSPCADRVSVLPATLRFTESGTEYQLETLGFIPGTLGTCTYSAGALRQSYISDENADNPVCLFARVSPVSESEMQIDKTTEATSLAPGDIVDYQIDYTCASTTSTCNGVEIVDFLPPELVYLSSTGSIHTVATTGTYSAAGNNVLFDFIDPLPAGSTGFVRIRVRVRDDGTLANGQQITNLASSSLSNGPTSNTSNTLSVTATSSWDVQKTALTSAYISTEPPLTDMTYNVQICPAGSNVNLLGAQMVDTLPAGSVYVSSTGGGSYNSTNHTVTWAMGDLSASGGCAARQVTVRFPNPPFTSGNNVLNTVTGTGTITGGTPFTDTANLPSTLGNFIPVPSVLIDKGTTRTDYVIGASVDYFLTPRNSGNTNLYNLRMYDNLPDQIRVTQVRTGASTYPVALEYALNGSVGYVTWPGSPFTSNTTLNVADLGLASTDWVTSLRWTFNPGSGTPPGWTLTDPAVIRGTITSPDRLGNPILEPSAITNTAYLSWEYLPGGVGDCTNPNAICGVDDEGATIDIVTVPVPVFTKSSAGGVSDSQRFIIGQDVGYYTLAVDNNTGIAVNNLTITDDIPVQFNVTSVNVGNYINYTGGLVGVSYATNGGSLVAWPGSPFAQGTTLSVASLSLPANTYISQLQFSYDQVTDPIGDPPAVSGGFSGSIRINGSTLATDRNGNAVNENDTMANASRIDWDFMGLPNNRTSNVSNPIHQPTAQLSASKTTTSTGPYIPTSAVSFRLSFGASSSSPSNIINAPVVADLLPLNVNYVSYVFNANGTALSAPTFTSIPNFQGTGRTLLRWTFTGSMNRGQTASIDLNTTLAAGTPNGSLQNTFGVSVNDMPMVNGTPDTQDWDGDTQTTDLIVTTNTSVFVDQLVGLDSQKRVRGELDSDYSVFPNYGRTVPNGDIDYRLTIINRGNIPVRNVRVIDILPFVGDTGVQDTRPRGSVWRPILTSLIAPQSGVTIYYSTATNPCRPEIVPSGPAGCTAPNWTLTPANLDAVRSVRFDFSGTLSPGQSFTFDWEMRAPNTALPPNNSIAWNSFAFTSTNATTGVPLRPAEPNKVGIRLVTDVPTALIDLKKYTSSVAAPTPLFDADLAPGPQISMIDTPLWTYVITNTGATRLGNIVLTDTPEGAVTSCTPALTPSTILEIGASMTCTLVDTTTAQQGQYANSATVTSLAVDGSGDPIDGDLVAPGVQEIHPQDTDPSHYYGYDPALSRLGDYTWIDLNADGIQDGGEPALGGITVHLLDAAGDPVDDPSQTGVQPYTTITDADGFYTFNNLLAGTYRVRFEIPSAYSLTLQNQGANDALDSDADPTTGETGTYTLAVAEYNQTADAGFIARAALGDRVWMDSDGDGIQDTGEPGYNLLDPMQVELLDGLNNVVATTTLDVDGMYFFDDLQPGVPYRVRFPAPPTGYLWTTLNASGSTTANDSNVSVTSPYTTAVITLDAGEYDPDWDAGLVVVAAIGDYVWNDADADGIQDSGESGVAGVTVRLLNSDGVTQATRDDGTPIPDVVTPSSGAYNFTNLRPADYRLRFTLPSGYIFTDVEQGSNVNADSDAYVSPVDITIGQTLTTTLSPNETDNSWDAGIIALASLGNFVWQDTNNNGQQDGGEPGVAGATVTLLDAATGDPITEDAWENPISPIITDGTGAYSFTNLDPRIDYVVQFDRPAGYVFSTANSGSDTTDSDAVPYAALPSNAGRARTGTIDLDAGENDTTIDAGLVQAASLGNFVWYDMDNDGQQTIGENGAQNVTVRLLNSGGTQATDEFGTLIPDLLTDVNGEYVFTNLRPGTYSLAFSTLPNTYTFARRDQGADATDSDPNRFTGRTITTTLVPNENDLTWDAGLVVAAALGNYVWIDANANGQQDGGEAAYSAGVTVRLLDGSNNPVDDPNTLDSTIGYEVTTNASGIYSFVGLPPNETYRVRFVRPSGYIWTRPNTGADTTDSDGTTLNVTAATTTSISITTLTPGTIDNDWDQGLLLPSALGNVVWSDNNDDGLQTNLNGTGGEPGINGVTVRLLDSTGTAVDDPTTGTVDTYTTTTAGSGLTTGTYAFTNLYPGQYIVEFVTPTGYKRADYLVGAGANATTDSDGQIANGRTATITLPYDTTDNSWDAGFVPLAALGNIVWRDLDNDGIQDGGLEVGVAGATVTLLDSATLLPVTVDGMGTAISPVVTTSTGLYSFTNLDPDLDYVVEFTLPTPTAGQSGYKFSPQDVVGTEATDSDANVTTGRTATIPLAPGQTNNDIDAGLTPLSSLGNYVWVDTNGNGVQDSGEVGINSVTVRLLTSGGTPVDDPNQVGVQNYEVTTVTNAGFDGYYQFINLDAGSYIVEFVLPTDYIFTVQDSSATGATDNNDSDANRFTGRTGTYTLAWGATNQTVDAGIVLPASLGNFVWYDADDDGVQDAVAAEAGVNGVVVRLLDASNNPVDNPNTPAVNDAYVIITANHPTTTEPGFYLFDGLLPGDYRVHFDLPASTLAQPSSNYVIARQNQGADDAADSDPARDTGITATINLSADEDDLTNDAGILLRGARLGNRVWIDLNNNGVQDVGEVGLNGVTVTLLNGSGGTDIDPITPGTQTLSTTTANDAVIGDGYYQFTSLVPGTYIVEVTLPAGYQFSPQNAGSPNDDTTDSDVDLTTGRTAVITISESGDDQTWDAGVVPLASIGNYTFIDQNNDGVQNNDPQDGPLAGVTVRLLDTSNNPVDDPNQVGTQDYVATTDGTGFYRFINLPPDVSYIVQFDLPAAYRRSPVDAATATDATDSDADLLNGRSPATYLSPDEYDDTVDAGFVPLARLGDYVWVDTDGDGVQDGTEVGLNGVTVRLLYSSGDPVDDPTQVGTQDYVVTTVTNAGLDGYYQFIDLDAGTYIVEFVRPTGYIFTFPDSASATDATDSDADRFTGRTGTYTLDWGDSNQTVDAGVIQPATLGNYVWVDVDGDGVQEGGENGINSVTVRLLDSSGNQTVDDPNQAGFQPYVTTTINNPVGGAPGYYQFTNLDAGTYIVEFVLPTGYVFTVQDSSATGANDTNDSDANRFTGRTGTYTLAWGATNQTVDAGIVLPAALGNYVWLDADDDGVQDGSEAGINGVTVHLLDGSGSPVDNPNTSTVGDAYTLTTVTNAGADGYYLFEGLFPRTYSVEFDLPDSDHVFARLNVGADDAIDSDADRVTGVTGTYTLIAGQTDDTVDAGMMLRASLGDFVWIDLNNNGVQDTGEVGLNGVTVTLLNSTGGTDIDPITAGTQTLSTTTATNAGADGYYLFDNLVPDTYSVTFTLPAGYQFSPRDAGSPNDDATDSDADFTTGSTVNTALLSGEDDMTWDAGVVPLASIGNYTFIDQNNDGIQNNDPQDGPLAGVTVRLLDTSNNPVDDPNQVGTQDYVATTDGTGFYRFINLPPDVSYIVQFDLPAGYRRSAVDAGSPNDDTTDSDASLLNGRSPATYLSPDEYDDTVDAGFVPLARLGDYVWVDTDGDGVQDGTEVGLNGVIVRLLDSSGDPVDDPTQVGTQDYVVTTVTNAGLDGYYQFIDLDAGTYIVEFVLPTGYTFTAHNSASATDATDSDADRFTGRTGTYTLDWGDSNQTVDAGMVLPSALGDFVWRDDNNDGVQDFGEPGVSGVVVNLLDGSGNPLDNPNTSTVGDAYTTTTDSNGTYSFTGLIPGTYIVEFVLPTPPAGTSGYKFSPQDAGADTSDSDASTTTGRTIVITLPIGTTDNRWDAGLTPLSSLGDFVWVDADGNGVQEPDPSEPGLNGVTVRLFDTNGSPVDDPNQVGTQDYVVTTVNHPTTGEPGYYQFINLDAGDYIVEVVLPTGYIFTRPDVGLDTGDSDVDRFTGLTGAYTLAWGDTDQTVDAGVLLPATLGNYVWLDADDNGVQDPGETGIDGVTVQLIDTNGAAIVDPNQTIPTPYIVTTSTVGGVAGSYSFVNLFPGDYVVRFVLPSADYVYSRPDVGSDSTDSDADRTTGETGTYTLAAGDNELTVDAGMLLRASIGDRVWIDMDNDGIQDAGENGLNGVLVTLTDENNVPYTTTTANHPITTAPGYYVFEDLVPGEYSLNFTLPFGYQFSPRDAGSPNDDSTDSDADFTTGDTVITRLVSNENDMTWDAGVVPLVSIGDRVWIDIDNNGVQDTGEANFPGIVVNLLDSTGNQIDTTTTDGTGNYLFDLLPPGVYAIEFELPYGYQFSPQDLGGSDSEDSDANFTTGRTINVTLLPDVDDMNWDAGMVPLTSIGDRVWIDIDNNGIQDTGEANYVGATVHLLNGSGNIIDTTTTDANGNYLFDLLPPGNYAIEVVLPAGYQFSPIDQGADEAIDSDVDFATGRSATTTLLPDEDDMNWDAGLVPLTSIGNFVWRDRNGDGIQGVGEPGISGIVINLLNSSGAVIDSTTTDINGGYLFDLLPPGVYAIEIDSVPPQFIITPLNQGADPALDSDVDPTTGRSVNTTLIPDEDDMTWDIGLAPLATLGDTVWYDNDGDGIQDVGEPGAPNITVRLLDSNGAVVATMLTDVQGNYYFENLLPGDYSIEFVLPGGYSFSPQDTGADDTIDSDADPLTGRTDPTSLAFDEIDPTWDAGLIALGSIGDFVWNDLDADGEQDPGEPGIPGVVVILTYPNGTTVTTTTDGSGRYLFVDLPAGVYTIRVDENTLPPGYGQTYDLNGELDHMATYPLAINEDAVTVDFGYVELGSIGDTIWVDTNRNGRVDGSERGIPNVTVTLVLPDGTTRTTVTDADGKYLFEDLYPGEYIVIVDVSTLPRGLQQVFDPDGTRDSRTVVVLGAGEHHLTADFGYAPPVVPTTPPEEVTPPDPADWQPVPSCQRDCVDWQLYHTNQTGDWEIFRLGNLGDRPSVSPNLSQGEGFDDMSPTRSPNAEWIAFTSNRDGNWELYVAPTDGDSSKTRRLTYNTVAIDTDPVWGPNNFVVYETTRDGNWELYMLDMVTGAERRLTENPGSDINAFWSNDGAKILFQSDRSGIWQIYELDLRTNEVTRLSDGTANDVDPQYSTDDTRIAFRSYRDDAEKSAIYLMDADGDNALRISDAAGDATNQSWSTDDRLIAYQSDLDGDLDIYVYDVASRTTRQLTDNDVDDYAPTWDCDSTTVVFTSDAGGNPDIYDADALPIAAPAIDVTQEANQLTIDPADDIYPEAAPVEENASREGRLPGMILGEQTEFLLPDTSTTVVDPSLERAEAWQPVNSCPQVCPAWTLYQTDRTGDVEIFRLGVDGASDRNLSVGIEATDRGPTRAPNAQWIAFTSDRDGNEEIYIASADGLAAQRRITYNAATDTDPAWSPDSQRIVYESDRNGDWNLYVLDVQTGIETQITTDAANDTNGDWSSAGDSIVFQSDRDGRSQLYVYHLGTGVTTRLIDIPQAATAPVYANGGSLIAFRVRETGGNTVIYVVQQDGTGLQAITDPDGSASSAEWYFDDTLLAYQSDLDGDLDIYVYDFATNTTRKLTDNNVADFAPTWICGEPDVIFTSEVTGNDDLFLAPALPIEDPALDVQASAEQLTSNPASDRFPVGAPNEEDGSRND